MLDSLPNRPLTDDEAEQLKQQDNRIVPLSVLKGGESPFVIYTFAVYLHEASRIHLLGYSENDNGWITFASLSEDEWTVELQEETVQSWIKEEHGDKYEQGILDEESNTVNLDL